MIVHFNPLPPCGGRPLRRICGADQQRISIHSLRVEGDAAKNQMLCQVIISIHSLRVEGDISGAMTANLPSKFQSTPSVWRETATAAAAAEEARFQSTPSVWRETQTSNSSFSVSTFQSTPSVWRETAKLHSFPLKTQQSKCNFDKKEHRYTSPCQKKYFFSDFFTKKRVRIPPAFFVRLGFAPERFLRTKAVPPHRWFPLRRYVPLSSDTDSPDSRTGGYPSRYRWHPSAAV